MDPVSIIGLAGSIVNIVDVIGKSIHKLRDLQRRWNAADLTVNSLTGHLTTLRLALNQIHTWISSSFSQNPQHEQLVIDLGDSLKCCDALINFLHDHLSQLDWTDKDELTMASKITAVFHDSEVKECQTQLTHQTSALTLLLTVLNWSVSSPRI